MINNILYSAVIATTLYLSPPTTVHQVVEKYGVTRTYQDASGNFSGSGHVLQVSTDMDILTVRPKRQNLIFQTTLPETHILMRKNRRVDKYNYMTIQQMEVVDTNSNEKYDPSIDKVIIQDRNMPIREITDPQYCETIFRDVYELVRMRLNLPTKHKDSDNQPTNSKPTQKPSGSGTTQHIPA